MATSSNEEPQSIDFTGKSFDEKKKIVIDLIFKMCNYTNMSATALDWSTSTMPLFVNLQMVLSFVQKLNFDRICAVLTGVKTSDEIFKIIFCEVIFF